MMTSAPRPRVTVHFAQSLDGRIGLPGARTLLSSPEGIELAHRARAEHDAVLVGSNTVRVDDPQLTVRVCSGAQPRRIVLASGLDIPLRARLLERGPGVLAIGVVGRATQEAQARLESMGTHVRLVEASSEGLVSLEAALCEIRRWGVERLLVEGGARVLTAFVRARAVDAMAIEIAPCLYGAPALSALGAIGLDTPERALALTDMRVERVGANFVVRGQVAY
jgi:5-amino-6-(5-phosphoribosylamino)uracil reductase/diaminohydroxyphosphoribosylaminopyrimidine deaminase/5-amino-6-(5-phosphoribosylamino)uracil reductase